MSAPDPTVKNASEWMEVLKNIWAEPKLDQELETALFHYLCDLEVFEEAESGLWALSWPANSKESLSEGLERIVQEKSKTEQGFALGHCVEGSVDEDPSIPSDSKAGSIPVGRSIFSRTKELPKGSSDPSNLQIVKKVGRQMESYIELEKSFMEKLPGRCTTRDDARKIYNFALSRTKHKADPQAWEQLSRRRHR